MSTAYRLIAIDVDGTLMNSRNELPPANRDALHRAHEAGITVCLCTGRSHTETRDVIAQLGLDSDRGIFAFGSIVSELPSGKTLHRTALGDDLTARLVTHFRERGFPVLMLYDAHETGGLDYELVRGERHAAAYEQFLKLAPAEIQRVDDWRPRGFAPVRVGIIDSPDHIQTTTAELDQAFPPAQMKYNPIYAPNYQLHVVECFAPPVNKWYGITQVARQMNIPREQIVAIGDDVNDIEMIREAGLGVAMGNAREIIKTLAAWHAPTQDQCGVAATIDAILSGRSLTRQRVA